MPKRIRGSRLRVGSHVRTWFMSGGTMVLEIQPYNGPLAYLWPEGAQIVTFVSNTRRGRTAMTVGNADYLERV